MADSAIPKDVETPAVQETEQQNDSVNQDPDAPTELDRDTMMNELARKRRAEMGISEEDRQEDAASKNEEDAASKNEEDKPKDKPETEETEDEELVLLKVNGRDIFKTKQEVEDAGGVAAIQKRLSGEMKLEEAARVRKELEQRQQQLDERERNLMEKEASLTSKKSSADEVTASDVKAQAEKLAEDLVLGDTSKVAAALENLLKMTSELPQSRQTQSEIDASKMASEIADQAQRQLEIRSARAAFARDYKDVYDNPVAKGYANEQTKILMRENPNWTPDKILSEAGKRTRAAMKPSNPAAGDLANKQQRKAQNTDNLAPAAARATPKPTEQERPKSKEEIFNQLAKGRSHSLEGA